MFFGCLRQDGKTNLGDQSFFFLSLFVTQHIIFNAAKMHTIPTKNIARFQMIAEQAIDEKLKAIYQELLFTIGIRGIQIGLVLG